MKFRPPDNFALKTGGMLPDPESSTARKAEQPNAEAADDNMFSGMLADLPDAGDGAAQEEASPTKAPEEVFDYDPRPSARARKAASAAPKSARPAARAPAAPIDPQSVSQQIMEHLEKHKIAAVSRLRIEVHDGVVVIAGEVPTAYERQLIGHFCRQIPGVVKFIDAMVLRSSQAPAVQKRAAKAPRTPRASIEWRLPFRARHIALAVGLLLTLWAGYSFATRDGSKMSVYTVTGSVLFEGQPAEGATVVLHPEDRSITIRPRGVVDADGSFELTTYLPGDGAPVGEYKVTIDWRKPVEVAGDFLPGPNLLPEALASVATTTLHASIPRGGGELEAFEITK
jgi:hypothetical protein